MKKPKSIFCITSHARETKLYRLSSKKSFLQPAHNRNWGFYFSLKEAKKAVAENRTDLNEADYYRWVSIEEVFDGLIATSGIRILYEFKKGKWREVKNVKWFDKYDDLTCNIG